MIVLSFRKGGLKGRIGPPQQSLSFFLPPTPTLAREAGEQASVPALGGRDSVAGLASEAAFRKGQLVGAPGHRLMARRGGVLGAARIRLGEPQLRGDNHRNSGDARSHQ